MAVDYTTTELIANLKRRASVPTNQSLFENSDFLGLMSDEMESVLVPLILAAREGYFATYSDTLLVAGTNTFDIPDRAVGGKLQDVLIVDSDGNTIQDLPSLNSHDQGIDTDDLERQMYGFFMEGMRVRLFPADNWVGYYLRMKYYRKPNRLVTEASAGQVTAIDTGTNTVTLGNVPTTWSTSTTFDVIEGRPHFRSLADDQAITALSGYDLTFSSLPTGLVVGDWVAEAGESPIPQVPFEAFKWLAQAGACKVVEALGKTSELQAAQGKLNVLENAFLKLISPRVDYAPKKIIPHHGIFRSRGER
jgi:hypothetical protein